MQALTDFAAAIWRHIVAFAKALNRALAVPPPLETDSFSRAHDDTVFQRRDL
jgi:hypothetical protein